MSKFNKLQNLLYENPTVDCFAVKRKFLLELLLEFQNSCVKRPRKDTPPSPPPCRTYKGGRETDESKAATEAWRKK